MMMMVIKMTTTMIYIPRIWSMVDIGCCMFLFVALSVSDGFLFLPCVYMAHFLSTLRMVKKKDM
jgi:hypothetical protein